jgi:glucose-6-phosphate 1-epimerase
MNATPSTPQWQIRHQAFGAQILLAGLPTTRLDPAGAASRPNENDHPALPVLYLSPLSAGEGAPIRGGVPVLFPQFNDEGPLPKHGFVRTAHWQVLTPVTVPDAADGSLEFSYGLEIGAHGDKLGAIQPDSWPHHARLQLTARCHNASLEIQLKVSNTGSEPFSWTGGLHPYFAVTDLLQARLEGLGGTPVRDRFHPTVKAQPLGPIHWDGTLYERLFDCNTPVVLHAGALRLRLSMRGFNQWMVWNPGIAGAKEMKDLPDADWQHFVCVEPVIVQRPCLVAPGETFEGALVLELEPA